MKHSSRIFFLFALTFFLNITACTVRIIAPYDEVTDRKVSDLQERIVAKFTEWERGVPEIASEYNFYDETSASLEILIFRNENIEKSDIMVSMLKKVQENIETIRQLHKESELTIEVVKQVKPDIMAQFNAIQKLQMALKRAEDRK